MFRCIHSFSSKGARDRHKGKCFGGGKSICPGCEKVYAEFGALQDHIAQEHTTEGILHLDFPSWITL